MKKLFLVDAYALIYRCYYAFMGRPMRNAEGLNTSAVFGFTKYLKEIIRRENPHYLGVAFDTKGPTFRHKMFPDYKANRLETPEDILASVPYIKRVVEAMRIPVLEMPGWEADDIIGTLSGKAAEHGFEVYMVTPDKDFGQLVRSHVYIYKQLRNGEGVEIIGLEKIKEYYGVDNPKLIIDILALWGDASDNIPGIPGIGEKSAIKLVQEFGTVEQILANIDKLKGKQKENILTMREQLMLSKRLATIDMDAPVEFDPDKLVMENPDPDALRRVYRELDFNMFIREMDMLDTQPATLTFDKQSVEVARDASVNTNSPDLFSPEYTGRKKVSMQGQGSLFGVQKVVSSTQNISDNVLNRDVDEGEDFDNVTTVAHQYIMVNDEAGLKRLIDTLNSSVEFCFDIETSGFDVFNDRIVGISFAVKPHEAWYVPFGNNAEKYAAMLKPLFENEKTAKIGQNIKFDIMVLANIGIEVRGFKYDTMLLHYLLNPESRHNMGYMSRMYLSYSPIEIEELIGKGAKQITMDVLPSEKVLEYAAEDSDITLQLKEVLWPKVIEEGLDKLYSEIEEPMIGVLAEIEMTGVKIDTQILAQSGEELKGHLGKIEAKVRDAAGEPDLNVNSAKQLGEALFGKLKIDPKPKMTKTKQYRTDEEYLMSLSDRNPIISMILEYRGIKKLLSTYIEALPLLVNSKTGRVHTSYNQAVTATGRLSSSNPNLQNIPVRSDEGREIRKAFVPSDNDHLIFSADYSQVELRLMAHLSGDENLLSAFRNKEDIHTSTASNLFGVPMAEVTPEQRRKAKTANFGIIYGISAFGLGQRLNIPRGEAKEIIDGYFRSYPGVKAYMERIIEDARETGYVSTIFGRKRWLKDIRSGNAVARGLAERNAINAPLQGSAADIMKLAMIAIHRSFKANAIRSKVIMQVHDELVVDLYTPEQAQVTDIVVRAMEDVAQLKVALTVDYGVGSNWLEAH